MGPTIILPRIVALMDEDVGSAPAQLVVPVKLLIDGSQFVTKDFQLTFVPVCGYV